MHPYSNRARNFTCIIFAGFLFLLTIPALLVDFSPARANTLCTTVFPDTTLTRTSYVSNDTAPRARNISPRALISSVARGQQLSSRFIHQSWKTHNLLPHVVPLADSWRLAYPDWEYVLWDDADNKELVRVLYPRLLEAYEALPSEIYRADFVRNLYMHAFGGIYADLDSEAIAPLESLLSASAERVVDSALVPVAFMGEMATSNNPAHGIPNAFFAASAAGHPFWFIPVEFAVAWVSGWKAQRAEGGIPVDPEFVTGPVALRHSLFMYSLPDRWPTPDASHPMQLTNSAPLPPLSDLPSPLAPNSTAPPVILLAPEIVYPYTWDTPHPHIASAPTKCVCWMHIRTYDRERCKARVGARWVLNYWGHGW